MSETAVPKLELGRVGEIVPRVDGIPKVTGEFAYSSDLQAAGMLWGQTVRSPHAHARVAAIDVSGAVGMPGVHAVLTHEDVPGTKRYGLEFQDQPVLAYDRVRYFGEPVALVAAEHPEQARRAAERIRVEYEPLEPIVDPERATEQEPLHPDRPTMGHGYRDDPRPNVVRSLVSLVVVPVPWQLATPRELAYLPDQLVWYTMVLLAPFGVVAGWRRNPLVTALLVGAVVPTAVALALTSGNIGTMLRLRGVMVPYLAVLTAVGGCEVLETLASRRRAFDLGGSTARLEGIRP